MNGACQPVLLAQGQDYPYGLAVNSTSVYWTTSGSVMAMTLDGGTLTTLASGQNYPVGLAIDPANAYWTNNGGDSVGTAPLSGGSFRILAGSQPKLAGGDRGRRVSSLLDRPGNRLNHERTERRRHGERARLGVQLARPAESELEVESTGRTRAMALS